MGLEISEAISHAADIVLLTFILVWRERKSERVKSTDIFSAYSQSPAIPSLDDDK
jgi:hypothetical protein